MFFSKYKLSSKKDSSLICLTEKEITALQIKAKHTPQSFSESTKISAESMAGDLQSRIRGAGIDFEENKPYQTGSDSRHINWRTYARTQQLYVNIYNEDKRPSTYVVLDQRQNMYFGTRQQLKIKQALNFAVYSIFRAMHQQQIVSGVQITDKPHWHSVYSGANSILSFIHELNTPFYHDNNANNEPTLNDVINKLQLTDGSELIIISDFHDMNKETISRLYHLSRKFKINLVRVLDPVEVELPTKGHFDLQNNTDLKPIYVNCNNQLLTDTYKQTIHDEFSEYRIQCKNMGINLITYLTTDNVFFD